jgi:hypothetical protein
MSTNGQIITTTILSTSAADAGTYIISMTTKTTQMSFVYSDLYVLNVVIIDPCSTPIWATNSIATITVSVL